jgi:site-specific recombinase XerD
METQYFISIVLDKRRIKGNGRFPVKLRVYTPYPKTQKLYPTNFEFTDKEFNSIWETTKPRNEFKETRRIIQAIENKAIDTAKGLTVFSFNEFEKKLFRKKGEGENVFYHYKTIIEGLKLEGQIGTASSYELSLKSLREYLSFLKVKDQSILFFNDITVKWLNNYEKFMTEKPKERSLTTVAIYLRALRAVFNKAINEKEIQLEIYPFGKRKYQIPAVRKVKKSLNKIELKTLFYTTPQNAEQEKAKAFWFFSYACSGMNIKDIALLRYKDLNEDRITYFRAKTIKTAKADLKPINVFLTDFTFQIIEKYGSKNKAPNQLIFDIINDNQNIEEQHWKIKNFTKFINQNLKKLAEKNNITGKISTYWARHSFATNAIRGGASMEFVSEALNHRDLKVTQGYFSGFEDNAKKEFMNSLMNF